MIPRFDLVVRGGTIVIRRGQIVLADGDCRTEPGSGRWVRRAPAGQCQGLALPS